MITMLAILFFIFGLIIGSFLNVVIYRMNTARSLGGRSACMSCQHKLSWYELIPLISYLALGGRCKNCKTKISAQYPLVEFINGFVYLTLFLKFSALGGILYTNIPVFVITYIYYAVIFSLLIVITFYDLKHKIIPDALSFTLGVFSFAGLFFFTGSDIYLFSLHIPSLLEFLAGPLVALPFFLFWLVSSGAWMGLGDAKLAIGLGWLLGLSRALSGIVIAFWTGAMIGILLIIFSHKHGMKSEIPFAPYLVLGAFLAFIFELHLFGSVF